MSIDTIIQHAFNKNPLGFEEALKEELRSRVALAIEAKVGDLDEAKAPKIACVKCDEVATQKAWEKNQGTCPHCKASTQGVQESTVLDEVSKDTVRSYADRAFRQANTILKRSLDDQPKAVQKASAAALDRRKKGIKMSGRRLGKDEMQAMADKARDEKY